MIIAREDVTRMKDLARKVSAEKNPVAIHQMETGFVHYMTIRYGEKTAITMLTKVWKLAAALKPAPEIE